ncbi:MAG: asparagine synthetase B [Rhodothermia bacterium]|nr:asparagine synthetase B [Rhodothermia bacterium]
MQKKFFSLFWALLLFGNINSRAQSILIPMDETQTDHLKAYGLVYWTLAQGMDVDWLLNYRGGSFMAAYNTAVEKELLIRGILFERIGDGTAQSILNEVQSPSNNMDVVKLEKQPRIAVYAPKQVLPWDDAVLMALTYAEVPYTQIYDKEIVSGELQNYDWLHLHHEDFTGQYGKFYAQYRNAPWYIEQQRTAEAEARNLGFRKVSQLKLAVAQTIRQYVLNGGFMFAMCSGSDTFDIALAAHKTDIAAAVFDGDALSPNAQNELDFDVTMAFQNFQVSMNPMEYEHSDIDVMPPPHLQDPSTDFFTLFEFSAKWDPVPTMLTQNHVATLRGFMGQATQYRKEKIKPTVTILGESPGRETVRYLYGPVGKGFFTFYGGHDPEDYRHYVGDPPTDLALHKSSPGYRLILNNVLFPAAKKKPHKT